MLRVSHQRLAPGHSDRAEEVCTLGMARSFFAESYLQVVMPAVRDRSVEIVICQTESCGYLRRRKKILIEYLDCLNTLKSKPLTIFSYFWRVAVALFFKPLLFTYI